MAKQFVYSTYKATFRTIPEVITHMHELNIELRRTDLSNLQFFNQTYFIITKNVYAHFGKHYFSDELLFKKVDLTFANYYFDALRKYVDNQNTTPAWKTAFDFNKRNSSQPIIYLALGVNAHVINDLGLSLFDSVEGTGFKKDYDAVNPIILQSVNEVIEELHLNSFYQHFMKVIILYWRQRAWNNYLGLKNKSLTKETIELNAEEIATALAKIHSFKDFYHLYKII